MQVNGWGYDAYPVSAATGQGLQSVRSLLADKIAVVAGPSGAGKSSIINALWTQKDLQHSSSSSSSSSGGQSNAIPANATDKPAEAAWAATAQPGEARWPAGPSSSQNGASSEAQGRGVNEAGVLPAEPPAEQAEEQNGLQPATHAPVPAQGTSAPLPAESPSQPAASQASSEAQPEFRLQPGAGNSAAQAAPIQDMLVVNNVGAPTVPAQLQQCLDSAVLVYARLHAGRQRVLPLHWPVEPACSLQTPVCRLPDRR